MGYVISVGVAAGLIWGCLWQVAYWFHFTRHAPGFFIRDYVSISFFPWLHLALYPLVTVLLAAVIFKSFKGPQSLPRAILVAAVCWILSGFLDVSNPLWQEWSDPDWNTWVTDYCLWLQQAVFLDFSLAWARSVNASPDRENST